MINSHHLVPRQYSRHQIVHRGEIILEVFLKNNYKKNETMKSLLLHFLHLLALYRFYSIANILSEIVVTPTFFLTVLSPIYEILFLIWLYSISAHVAENLKGKQSKNVPIFRAINFFTIYKCFAREVINISIYVVMVEQHLQHNILPKSADELCSKPLLQWKPLKGGDFCLHKTLMTRVLLNECVNYNLFRTNEVLTKHGL